MIRLINTWGRRSAWAVLVLLFSFGAVILHIHLFGLGTTPITDENIMKRLLVIPLIAAFTAFGLMWAVATSPVLATSTNMATTSATPATSPTKPFVAQVVGLQWLNPLQRRDYPTEWELLWTLGLAKPNISDEMVKSKPEKYRTIQTVGSIAIGNNGEETFQGYHEKYVEKTILYYRQPYFSDSKYFYTVNSDDKRGWRELAGIHVEYALPEGKLDPVEAGDFLRDRIARTFIIGNPNFPTVWTRSTPPDVRVTLGGANAGFTSLAAGLDYLQAHPSESVWVMNWDAPSRPLDKQINENMVLLILAGPQFNTERAALAWIGYPASQPVADFQAEKGRPPRAVQAWQATLTAAARNAGKAETEIGYVIHDAHNRAPDASERIGHLAEMLTAELPEFDFVKQTFNTPALLGDMGASTALTNVALAIAYANHIGKTVLVAGTSDAERPTAVVVAPPEKVRPINPDKDWFRARGENNAYLPWWGLRHDAPAYEQGYSQ